MHARIFLALVLFCTFLFGAIVPSSDPRDKYTSTDLIVRALIWGAYTTLLMLWVLTWAMNRL
jgi:hypothetical protein